MTAVFDASLLGDFLPPLLVYQGMSSQLYFSLNMEHHFSADHWSNEETMREYIKMVIFPYIKDLDLSDELGCIFNLQ